MIYNLNDYRKKVLGCWMGKNIGGTLGAPMEWARQVNDVSFYVQDLKGEPLPNDDLDIQLLWLLALEEKGVALDANVLAEYWLSFMTPHWAEYGNSKTNLRSGLMPPLASAYDNCFKDSNGSFIRSEIWACIAPGCPDVAVKYAYEDSIIDHGNGEGIYAEMFTAAIESAAFVESDTYKLIDIGLSYIPEDCGVARAVRCAIDSYKAGKTWLEARDEIFEKFRARYWDFAGISDRDREKGFADGPVGYDVPANIALFIIGWLYGEGDFDKTMCITVNCGEDTDCTAATVGSIWGIIHGIDAIPQKWIEPIGRGIKTLCLDIGDIWYIPATIDELTDRVERIAKIVTLTYRSDFVFSETKESDFSSLKNEYLYANDAAKELISNPLGPIYHSDTFDVLVEYPDGPYIRNGQPAKINIRILNKHRHPHMVNLKWYLDEGFTISPSRIGRVFTGGWWTDRFKAHSFEITAENVPGNLNRFVLELTVDGRHTVMLVPIVLVNKNI